MDVESKSKVQATIKSWINVRKFEHGRPSQEGPEDDDLRYIVTKVPPGKSNYDKNILCHFSALVGEIASHA